MPVYCEVALPVPLDRTFTYAVRNGQKPERGARVIVPFRKEKLIGVVTAMNQLAPPDFEVRYLEAVLDGPMDDDPSKGTRAIHPSDKDLSPGTPAIHPVDKDPSPGTPVDGGPLLSEHLMKLGEWIAQYYLAPVGEVLRGMLPLMAEVRRIVYYRITDRGRDVLAASKDGDQGTKGPRKQGAGNRG